MMPIFFHANAHLWILLALFASGFTLHLLCHSISKQYRSLVAPLEAQVLISFAFSLAINGFTLLALDLTGLAFSNAIYVLPALTISLLTIALLRGVFSDWNMDVNFPGLLLYAAMFVVLFYNGGMIDQISDAWWHMSLANKIGWANSFTLDYGHLTGTPTRYYPQLWHANLALLRELSGQSLPSLWNAFTAWGGVLKLMAYYLLGCALFKNKMIGFFGALLFALLPGIGNSYMRVSAWPSHLSYIVWFFAIYFVFSFLDKSKRVLTLKGYAKFCVEQWVAIALVALLITLAFFLHQLEVLIFIIAVFLYLAGLSLYRVFAKEETELLLDAKQPALIYLYRTGLIVLILMASYLLVTSSKVGQNVDYLIVLVLPIILFVTLLIVDVLPDSKIHLARWLSLAVFVLLLATIDFKHLGSLFVYEWSLPKGLSGERPVLATGYFGGILGVAGWDLQLRNGLLWSGLVGGLLSVFMCFRKPSNAWIFTSICIGVVWLVCSSPYIYQWLSDALSYHSVWRIAILSFHPLVLAAFLFRLLTSLAKPTEQTANRI